LLYSEEGEHVLEQEVGAMQVAILTGASKGLGRALASGLAQAGWSLVVDARGETELGRAGEAIGRLCRPGASVVAVHGDVGSPAHRSRLVQEAARLGGLDLLVNNASTLGESPLPPMSGYPLGVLREVLETDVVAPLALFQECAGLLKGSADPRLLDITSDASVEHYEGWGGYGLAKAALDHATGTIAAENPWLRAWALDPGDLRTQMHQLAFPGEDISDRPLPEEVVPRIVGLIDSDLPSGRYKAADLERETAVTR
jgi:NAD(P)-dependent dehydrogenase (short-subunit alcohol dehydrogenase family)